MRDQLHKHVFGPSQVRLSVCSRTPALVGRSGGAFVGFESWECELLRFSTHEDIGEHHIHKSHT